MYAAPKITAAGLSISSYADILAYLTSSYLGIEGQQVYLGADSSDYQMLSLFALMISDCHQGLQLCYQQRSPGSAVSAGLDGVVLCNGLTRLGASYGTVQLTLTGTAGTVIAQGSVQDVNGETWILPQSVAIGSNGTVSCIATCADPGNIPADVNTVTIINAPQAGWTAVTNPLAATPGAASESDSSLRERQAVSVQGPSVSPLGSVYAAVAAVAGVTRLNVLENPTGAVDSYGNAAHSISVVAEGGADLNIATAIYGKKTIGAETNSGQPGTVTVTVTNSFNNSQEPISFVRPMYVPVYVIVNLKPLAGYTTATAAAIQAALTAYLNSLEIGQAVYSSDLFGVALTVNPSLIAPVFAIRSVLLGNAPSPATANDLLLTFYQVAQGLVANMTVVQVS